MTTMEDRMLEHGMKIDRVNRAHLQAVLRTFEDPAAAEKDTTKLASAAQRRFLTMSDAYGKKTGVVTWDTCDVCGGRSPGELELDACPFCGTVGEATSVTEAAVVVEPEADATKPEAAVVPEANGAVAAPTNGVGTTALAKRTKTKTGIVKPDDVAVIEVHGAEVVPSDVLETDDFDTAHRWCRDAKVAGAVSLWRLGHGIGVIVDKKLWQQRKNGKKQVYASFDAYCFKELGMTHGNAYELMDVAKRYTAEQVHAWGTTKCGLLLRAPDEAKPEIREAMDKGASVRQVRELVKGAREKAGTIGKPRVTGRKAMPQPKTRRVSDKITVAMTKPTRVLQAFTRATMKSEDPKCAKRIVDEPTAEMELTNRVKLRISASHDNKGNIVFRVTFKRDEA